MTEIDPPEPEPRRAADETFLRTWLFDRDEPCPLCGYNLRGLTIPRCPECWQALRLSVSLAEPYLKAWIALIAGLLPPAGIGAIFVLVFLFAALPREGIDTAIRDIERMTFMEVFCTLHVISCVPLSIMAIAMRRRFLRWNRSAQTMCAVAAWAAILISGFYLLAQVR